MLRWRNFAFLLNLSFQRTQYRKVYNRNNFFPASPPGAERAAGYQIGVGTLSYDKISPASVLYCSHSWLSLTPVYFACSFNFRRKSSKKPTQEGPQLQRFFLLLKVLLQRAGTPIEHGWHRLPERQVA
ncbi:hypothetical protein SUGI_0999870 [Cryptomeria japonica]|nr:hypothetical protein SUGI_0999870 [Cryptomeria japonica]